jgi:hypothetical protein
MIEYRAETENVFAITYDRFERLGDVRLDSLSTEYHLRNIIGLALLGFLLEFQARSIPAPAFNNAERQLIEVLCQQYLGRITRLEALDAMKSLRTLSSRAKQILRDWSGPIGSLFSTALKSHGLPGVSLASPGTPAVGNSEGPLKVHLEELVRLIKSIGFRSVYVLVDKVDETAETGNNAEASFLLMKPLLRDLELLQLRGIGFKFFLWDKIEPHYREYARPDRLQQFELSWSGDEMNKMLSRRLGAFSAGVVTDLGQLAAAETAEPLQMMVVMFAAGSPRDMIRICREILAEQLQLDAESEKIELDAIVRGISTFAERRTKELLPPQVFQELLKVGFVDFTANYIASNIFKIEVNSARNKIVQWTKTGAVEKVGELHTGGRPVHQYAVTDVRVAKAILPQLELGDFFAQKIKACDQCDTLLIRDWELGGLHTCHRCGTEQKHPAWVRVKQVATE